MTLFDFYLIFAVTTATVSVYELYWPVLKILKEVDPLNPVNTHWILSIIVYWLIALVCAPFMFFICIVPSFGNRYKDRILMGMIK